MDVKTATGGEPKTLHLHIGTQKTGTTALQRFCVKNRKLLRTLGYSYPKMPFSYPYVLDSRNGHFLIGSVSGSASVRPAAEEEAERRAAGFGIIAGAFERYANVILSEERLWDFSAAQPDPFWDELLQHAGKHGYRVHVIVYLRRQDQLAMSWYNQMVKQGSDVQGSQFWGHWVANPPVIQLDYWANLQRIAALVGPENITVRVYDRAQLEKDGGSIYSDFLGCVGLQLDERFTLPAHDRNSGSLSPNMLAIKRAVNASPNHTRAGDAVFRRAAVLCSAEPGEAPATSLFSPQEAQAFLACYEEGNARVAQEYLHREGPLFSTQVSQVQKWQADNPWLLDDVVRYFLQVNQLQAELLQASQQEAASQEAGQQEPATFDATTWLQALEAYPVRMDNHCLYTARCLGELFLARQRDIDAGRAVCPLDEKAVRSLAEMLRVQAHKLAEADEAARAAKREADEAARAAKREAVSLPQRVARRLKRLL